MTYKKYLTFKASILYSVISTPAERVLISLRGDFYANFTSPGCQELIGDLSRSDQPISTLESGRRI